MTRLIVGSGRSADPVEQAVIDGKLAPSAVPAWRERLARDRNGTVAALGALASGFPAGWVHEDVDFSAEAGSGGPEDYPSDWLTPAERQRAAAVVPAPAQAQEAPAPAPAPARVHVQAGPATQDPGEAYPKEWLTPEERAPRKPKRIEFVAND